jgi:hypothetical protein
VIDPYRDPAPVPAPERCEICGIKAKAQRCASCLAVEHLMPTLEFPVVVVACNWSLGSQFGGAGFVLVDLWREVAQCACVLPFSSGRAVESVAYTRAALWAPGATVASTKTEIDNAFAESLVRTPTAAHPAVQRRFERAVTRACGNAEAGRGHWYLGSQIWPESER